RAAYSGLVSPHSGLCRQDPPRREARRPSSRAADQVRVRHQSYRRQGARPRGAGHVSRPSRRGHRMIPRREFIALIGGAAVGWPLSVWAQQGERVPLVGILSNIIEDDLAMKARVGAFRQELEKFGWLPGRSVRIETRFGAVTPQQLQASAKELLA